MGYTTKFSGVLRFPEDMTLEMLQVLKPLLGVDSRERDDAPDADWTYMQFVVTDDVKGIEWDGAEKFCGAVDAVNWLTCKMRERFPDFKFSGSLDAQGEEIGDVWTLRVGETGHATKIDAPPPGTPATCPDCGCDFFLKDKADQTIRLVRLNDRTVEYNSSPEMQKKIFDAVIAWYMKHEVFSGESVVQCDAPSIDASSFLAELADDTIGFKVEWDEQERRYKKGDQPRGAYAASGGLHVFPDSYSLPRHSGYRGRHYLLAH